MRYNTEKKVAAQIKTRFSMERFGGPPRLLKRYGADYQSMYGDLAELETLLLNVKTLLVQDGVALDTIGFAFVSEDEFGEPVAILQIEALREANEREVAEYEAKESARNKELLQKKEAELAFLKIQLGVK
jgi:hypothetical protein